MPRSCNFTLWILCAALLAGCLETEEQITVLEDGSARVQITVSGDLQDFADGWPIPNGPPWEPVGETAARWWRDGASLEPEALRGLVADGSEATKLELSVRGRFRSVEDWPSNNAPPGAAHREAHLQRLSRLAIRKKGGQRLYTFERTLKASSRAGWITWHLTEESFPEDLKKKLSSDQPVSREDWGRVASIVRSALLEQADRFVREALTLLALEDGARLPAKTITRAVAAARKATGKIVSEERILAIATAEEAGKKRRRWGKPEPAGPPDLFGKLEHDERAALRRVLAEVLRESGIASDALTHTLAALDQAFVAFDALRDLGDETFRTAVTMPGKVLSGNYDRLDGNRASWTIHGPSLQQHDFQMSVISVLE